MFDVDSILWFALGFAAGGIFISVTNFFLFLPKMRELDKEFNDLRMENRELKCFLIGVGGSNG